MAVVERPNRMMAIANGLAAAGVPHVVELLQSGEQLPIWNLTDAFETMVDVSRIGSPFCWMDGRQNYLRDVAGGSVNLPSPSAQVVWCDRAEEHNERHGGPASGFQLCHASSRSGPSPFSMR